MLDDYICKESRAHLQIPLYHTRHCWLWASWAFCAFCQLTQKWPIKNNIVLIGFFFSWAIFRLIYCINASTWVWSHNYTFLKNKEWKYTDWIIFLQYSKFAIKIVPFPANMFHIFNPYFLENPAIGLFSCGHHPGHTKIVLQLGFESLSCTMFTPLKKCTSCSLERFKWDLHPSLLTFSWLLVMMASFHSTSGYSRLTKSIVLCLVIMSRAC